MADPKAVRRALMIAGKKARNELLRDTPGYNPKLETFLRFGDVPEGERSKNWITGGREKGVSVYALNHKGAITRPAGDTGEAGIRVEESLGMYETAKGEKKLPLPRKLVQGRRVGIGEDEEPVIRDIAEVPATWHQPQRGTQAYYGPRAEFQRDPPPRLEVYDAKFAKGGNTGNADELTFGGKPLDEKAKNVRRALMIASEPLKVSSTYAAMEPDARAAWKTDQMAREGHGSFSPPGTPEREENFNRWNNRSKVRDGEGNPLRLYHATPKSFDTFLPGGTQHESEMPSGPATWLSPYPDKQSAGHHVGGYEGNFKSGTNVMPVHADIRNPLVIDNKGMRDWARQSYAKGSGEFPLLISPETRKMLLEDGYDGIFWAGFDATSKDEAFYGDHGIGEHPSKDEEIIALHPPGRAQIKSAIGNRGQYDPEDLHVNYARGGGDVRHEVGSPERQQAFDQWGGAPERWYHGTSKDVDFPKFKIGRHGAWFARDPQEASKYAEQNDSQGHRYEDGKFVPTNTRSRVIPVHLKLGKSHTGPMPDNFLGAQNYKKAQSEWFDQLRAQGYDSWTPEGQNVAVILKDPTQIKSAIGNRGTYDPNEADIGKAAGGPVDDQLDKIGYRQDNPAVSRGSTEWLASKQRTAYSDPALLRGAVTGYFKDIVHIPVDMLDGVPGANKENPVPGTYKYDELMKDVKKDGWKPTPILVGVNHKGKPHILEGNHRVAVARALGQTHIPGDIRWWNGGEEVDGPWHPKRIAHRLTVAERTKRADGGPIDTYHGSPHDFDKFDFSKIGTGEGAQAYGHGLYLADQETVARQYKMPAVMSASPEINGVKNAKSNYEYFRDGPTMVDKGSKKIVRMPPQSHEAAIKSVYDDLTETPEKAHIHRHTLNALTKFAEKGEWPELGEGRLYDVRLHADPESLLDLDRPMAEQSPRVKKALALRPTNTGIGGGPKLYSESTGLYIPDKPDIARSVVPVRDKGAAASMEKAGIPGVRYYDGYSRSRGDGSRNYVVFPTDKDILEITRKRASGGKADAKRALMIARDQRALLRRVANIYPGPGGGMDPSPGGGGYSGPGGGKYIGPSHYADGGSVPPFRLHSGAAKIIGAKGQAKATPQQYAAMPGIKPDELKHSNFDTLGSKALPREEVIKHLEDNALPLEETTYTGDDEQSALRRYGEDKTALPGGKNYREVLLYLPHAPKTDTPAARMSYLRDRMEYSNDATDEDMAEFDRLAAAGHHAHQEPQTAYRSSHWDQPNVLAHVRMSDRRGPNGEKILHLEEAQSDWGQQGREKGFKQSPEELERLLAERAKLRNEVDSASRTPEQHARIRALDDAITKADGPPPGPYVDNTQKWTDLALKRVLHEAAHGGYDKIAFTPGDEQNKRYDLSSQVKNIQYYPDTKYLGATTHDNRGVEHEGVEPDDLSKHIGKEAADRILKQPLQRFEGRGKLGGEFYHELEGEGLKVGGEGMRGYYDNILPKRLQALAQQHDPQAKVNLHAHDLAAKPSDPFEEHKQHYADSYQAFEGQPHANDAELRNWARDFSPDDFHGVDDDPVKAAPLHSLDVTPQMRDSIKANGFNSFKRGGDVGMRQRYADGGGADAPGVNKALDLVSMFQPAKPMMAQRVAPQQGGQMIEPGSVSIKSLTESFDKAIQHHTSLGPEERAANSRAALQTIAPHLGKSKTGVPSPLLTKNAKLMKSEEGYKGGAPISLPNGQGVETTGLALAPAYQEGKFTTCPNSASCKKECLGKFAGGYFYAGGGQDPDALKGPRLNSVRKTVAMLREPEAFAVRLHDEIEAAKRMASMNNNMLGVRLNVLSDINPRVHKALFDAHPDVAFYDYTKNNTNPIAPNHHYTYSSTGVSDSDVDNPHSNWKQMRKRLDTGANVAMAFSHKAHLPETVFDEETGKRYKVTNGDSHDFRPLDIQQKDQPGVIVGLRNKKISSTNAAAHRTSNGFFVRYNPDFLVGNEGKRVKDMHGNPIAQNTEVRIQHQKTAPTLKSNDEAETP